MIDLRIDLTIKPDVRQFLPRRFAGVARNQVKLEFLQAQIGVYFEYKWTEIGQTKSRAKTIEIDVGQAQD